MSNDRSYPDYAMRDIFSGLKLFDIDLYKLRSRNFHADMIRDRERTFADYAGCLRKENEFVCSLCGGCAKKPYVAWRNYTLYECQDCFAVSPNVDVTKISALNLHASPVMTEDVKREIIATYDYRKQTFAAERVKFLRELIPGFGGPGEAVLDVGCGPGYFLSELKDRDISARGLEVNPLCVNFCVEHGLDVTNRHLADEPDGAYSLITLFDVLEHLDGPMDFFCTAAKKLRPGGHLLAYTPNVHSVSTYLMGGEHNMMAVFNHLCFYDRKSLDFLARHTGFEITHQVCYGLDVMDYLAMKEAEDGHPYFERLRPMVGLLQALVDARGIGNHIRVLFRKD